MDQALMEKFTGKEKSGEERNGLGAQYLAGVSVAACQIKGETLMLIL